MNVVLKSGPASVTVDLSRGADIVSYIDQRIGGEMLWLADQADVERPFSSEIGHNTQAFYDDYRGGIQELFPNTANATTVLGAELPFHGELCRTPMGAIERTTNSVAVSATLRRYPVRVTKSISLGDTGALKVASSVENLSTRELPYSWGLHPVFSLVSHEQSSVPSNSL